MTITPCIDLSVILLFLGTPSPHFDKKVVNINCFSRLDKQQFFEKKVLEKKKYYESKTFP